MVVRRNDDVTLADIATLAPQKIVISPGPCTPSESGVSLDVIWHYAGKLPILGVCRAIRPLPGIRRHHRACRESDARENVAGHAYQYRGIHGAQ